MLTASKGDHERGHRHARVRPASCGYLGGLVCALALLAGVCLAGVGPACAAGANAYLSGVVTDGGRPVPGVRVTIAGNNLALHVTTDGAGRFSVSGLAPGSYDVQAARGDKAARARVDVGVAGASVVLALGRLAQLGHVTVVGNAPLRGSGTDVVMNREMLARSPSAGSFPEMLIQLPGAVRGANGVVHVNGDHGAINYLIDGVPLPQALNRAIGSEIDPSDVAFVDAIEGAYPAQYGLRFGSTLSIATRAGTGPAGWSGSFDAGSYTLLDDDLSYHAPLSGGGGLVAALHLEQSTRGLDPPDFDSPHNHASDANEFLRMALPRGNAGFADMTLINSYQTFQIPNDVSHGEPATTDDNETQADTFLSLQFRQSTPHDGALSWGPAFKVSHIRDFGDPANDFAFGEAINIAPPPFGNGGSPNDCANALRTGLFGPTTCGYSLTDDKTALDAILQADGVQRAGPHEVRGGIFVDATRVLKRYAVTLQPGNFLAPLFTPATPGAAYTVTDDGPNAGRTYSVYLQDSWRLGSAYEVDDGLRDDVFSIRSTNFARTFGQLSPRLKVTRFFGSRASLYVYLGRFFEPFSLENVDPRAAQLLNLPLQPHLAQFDLKPERDTQLELGGHLPLGPGSLGFRVWQKNANDLIDDTQVGVTLLHQDINYTLGRLSQEALTYSLPLSRDGQLAASVAHTLSLNKGCETQLLAPCFGSPTDWTPADHDQSYSATADLVWNDAHGGWWSADAEYGSGLSSAVCPPTTPGFCKRTPHTVVSVERAIRLGTQTRLRMRIQNLFNDRYYVTLLNAQGNHVAPPRLFDVGLSFGER
jgi:hypothetical protein